MSATAPALIFVGCLMMAAAREIAYFFRDTELHPRG